MCCVLSDMRAHVPSRTILILPLQYLEKVSDDPRNKNSDGEIYAPEYVQLSSPCNMIRRTNCKTCARDSSLLGYNHQIIRL